MDGSRGTPQPRGGLAPAVREALFAGVAIPAHPLALTAGRQLDVRRQRALSRYYCEAGAGGLAVGVHTTQFAIRDPKVGLFKPVLQLAVETIRSHEEASGRRMVRVAGVCGKTDQAVCEAGFARDSGYDLALLSLGAMRGATEGELIAHCRTVSGILPLFGFYLQAAVGGRPLGYSFWRSFFEIENVAAVKVAPFNRYQTLDVVRALADSGRAGDIALYTGNDDNIVVDLLSQYPLAGPSGPVTVAFSGGLLGHWAVWTRRAVELLERVGSARRAGGSSFAEVLALAAPVTDANAALFDAANGFAGCIAGLHEVLRRQGLLEGRWCLDSTEDLSPGQLEEIERVHRCYPFLNDDEFVAEHRDRWLSD
jgi:dihydrodipicolinate synthase/N-acetylneuraminate lyase